MTSRTMRYQRLKILLLIILAAALLFLSGLYLSRDPGSDGTSMKDVSIDSSADIKLDRMEQVSKKNGITEWSLKASSARVLKEKNQAILEDVNIVFHLKDGSRAHLTSRNGMLNTRTHDMTFSDNVVVTHKDSVLETDKLHYNKKKHILYSNTEVELIKGDSVIVADAMKTDLNENTTTLEGNVRGEISEDINIL